MTQTETRTELEAALRKDQPYYDEAKKIHISLLFAGDDGSWAGETDAVRLHLLTTARLAVGLTRVIAAERESCAAILDDMANDCANAGAMTDASLYGLAAERIRARGNAE